MDLVEDFAEPGVSIVAACAAVGASRATLYRGTRPVPPRAPRQRAPSPRRLGDDERQAIVDAMHSPEFVDQPPMEVFAKLLSRGVYLASIRTFYRVLAALGESKERRNQRLPHSHVKPSLTATAPNQVWTWDITKLATLEKGIFLHVYVIIDLFSRYVVGWLVAAKECKHLAAQLFAEAAARHGIEPGLIVHADRGSSMKSDTCAALGVARRRPELQPASRLRRQPVQRVRVQDPQVPTRLSWLLRGPAPRSWMAEHVLRLAQRRAPTFRPCALHARRGVLRPRAGGAR